MNLLIEHMKRHGVTQSQIAAWFDPPIAQPSVCNWFKVGGMPYHRAVVVSQRTGVPLESLIKPLPAATQQRQESTNDVV